MKTPNPTYSTRAARAARRGAISGLELLIVFIIIGLVAALTIPQFSRAGQTTRDEQLRRDLRAWRTAIELYYRDHGHYPAQSGDGSIEGGPGTVAALLSQLTRYTNAAGVASIARDESHRFGPYLRDGVPESPVPPNVGARGVAIVRGEQSPAFLADAPEAGWVFNCDTGYIAANSDRVDSSGVRFDRY